MNPHEEQTVIRDAMIHTLSGLEEDPWLSARILADAKGAEPVKKKLSLSLILVIALIILSLSAALAAGLGLFGQLSGTEFADERLPALDSIAEPVTESVTAEYGITFEITQAFYDRNRIFMSYRFSAPDGLYNVSLHEGAPDIQDSLFKTRHNYIPAEHAEDEESDGLPEVNRWLDGKGQRWAEYLGYMIHDNLSLEDDTDLNIIASDEIRQEDGSYIGWKQCEIPEECLADTLTFKASISTGKIICFQDGTTYKEYIDNKPLDVPFTVTRDNHLVKLKCDVATDTHRGWAEVTCSRIDTQVSIHETRIREDDPDEDEDADYIVGWELYQDGRPVQFVSDMSWGEDSDIPGESVWTNFYQQLDHYDNLSLVPFYSETEAHPDEAVQLERVEE